MFKVTAFFYFALLACNIAAQTQYVASNDANLPCITPAEYALIMQRCTENSQVLGLENKGVSYNILNTALAWPLRPANGLDDCGYSVIGAYVDQNTTVGAFSDYNCGNRTYDGHRGTDIAIWPFPFVKMEQSLVEVVSAAPGIILDKSDGNFDRNCAANNLTANYVVIQHEDGSRALYWHMKMGAVTQKAIGATVAAGEYLGVVGSSGSSSGPHLHFEVWAGSTVSTRIDPYAGSCNTLNSESWWIIQPDYSMPSVLKASVHTTDIVVPGCPATEIPNESNCFSLPFQGAGLPAGSAKFYAFLREETAGLTVNARILNPDGSIFNNWSFSSSGTYNGSWRQWTKPLPTTTGMYTFQAEYNGMSCSSVFEVLAVPVISANGTLLSSSYPTGNQWYLNNSILEGATGSTYDAVQTGDYKVVVTGINGCTNTSSDYHFLSTGTTETAGLLAVSIVPNPNSGKFNLYLKPDGISRLEIFNLLGIKVFDAEIQHDSQEIDISSQPAGLYLLVNMTSGNRKQCVMMLKQ